MNIVGHKKIIKYFNRNIEKNSLSHAYLFSGPENVGKFKVACEFAAKLVGKGEREINPDIIILRPETEIKKGMAKKKDIKIETIRELEHSLRLSSYSGGFKAAIIDEAEYLTRSAQNALLKTLEEPPEKTVIFLVTKNKEKILPTVFSRCQEIKFGLVAEQEIRKLLPDNSPKAERILFWSMGRPGLANNFLKHPKELDEREAEQKDFRQLFSLSASDQLALAEKISKNVSEMEKKLQLWTVILRAGRDFSKFILIEKIEESLKIIRETNANPRLVLENLFLNLASFRD